MVQEIALRGQVPGGPLHVKTMNEPSIAWNPTGAMLAWTAFAPKVYDLTGVNNKVRQLEVYRVPGAATVEGSLLLPECYAFSPDGRLLAGGSGRVKGRQPETNHGIQIWGIVQ